MSNNLNITGPNNEIIITTTENKVVVNEDTLHNIEVTQPVTQVVEIVTGPLGPKGDKGDFPTSGSINFTGSYNISGSLIITGSVISTQGFTGSLNGTSSWAVNSETASYVNPLTQNVIITGSLTVSGSSTFTNIGPAIFSGSVVGVEGFTGSFLGDLIGTASYVDFNNVDGLNLFSSSISTRVTDLENFSSSLDNTFATDAELNAYTASTNNRLNFLEVESGSIRSDFNSFTSSYITDSSSFENRITTNEADILALQSFSSSLDNTFATDAELNNYTASTNIRLDALEAESGSIRSDFNSFTSSYNIDSASFSSRVSINESDISALQSFSSSLDNTFATDAELAAATASLSASISDLSSSYLSTSASFSNDINTNINDISALSSSFISFSSSYNTGSFTGSFIGDLQGTASYSLQSLSSSYSLSSSFADYSISASNALTASYVNPLNQDVLISGSLKLDPTHDPDPSGLDLDSTVLFQSSSNTSLGYDLYIRQNGNLIKWKWVEGVVNTGLLFGGVVTYSGSTVFVSSGSGIIVDHNATTTQEISPIITYVNWSNISQSISNISTQQVTYLYIDQNGDLQQQSTRFTNDQYHDYIPLGAVGHFDYTQVSAFGGQVQTAYDQVSQISTFVDAFGPLKISGYGLTGQAGSLRLSVGSGQSFIHGGFYENNPELPSTITTNAQATASIAYVYRSGSGAAFDTNGGNLYTSLRPGFYDPGTGVTGSVSNNDWTIQRAYSDPKTGVLYIYYGQTIYPDYNTALANLSSDSFTEGDTFDFTIFVGFLILKSNTTNITNTGDNKIIPAGLFRGSGQGGGGGSAVSNLDDLSDVSITGPIDGEALVYNAGIWGNGTPTSSSYSVTSSLALNAVTASFAQTASFAPDYVLTSVTSSMLSSYILSSQTSSMSVASASVATSSSYALTASYALNGGGGGSTDTGSLLVTASAALNVITFTKGDNSTFNVTVDTGSAGGATGPFGVANSSGVYTYYTTFQAAINGANAGQTVEMFADVIETGAVTINLKNEVNINGNGHTYTLSTTSAGAAISDNNVAVAVSINNLTVRRTNAPTTALTNSALSSTAISTFHLDGSRFYNTNGSAIYGNSTGFRMYNGWGEGTVNGIYTQGIVYNSTGITTTAGAGGGWGIIVASTGALYGCLGIATSAGQGLSVQSTTVGAHNCVGISVSGPGIGSSASGNGPYWNCVGRSTSGIGMSLIISAYNCTAISISGAAFTPGSTGFAQNCVFNSSSNYAYDTFQARDFTLQNCTLTSTTNIPAFYNNGLSLIKNSVITCNWNNAGGHGIRINTNTAGSVILNNSIKVTNASANCISANQAATNVKYAGNKFEGSTTAVNANVVQAITNTEDSQGNILI